MEGPTEGGSQRETVGGGASDGPEPVETTSEEMRPHMKMGNANRGRRLILIPSSRKKKRKKKSTGGPMSVKVNIPVV